MKHTKFTLTFLFVTLLSAQSGLAQEADVRLGDHRNGKKLFDDLISKCRDKCGAVLKADSLNNGNRISVQNNKTLLTSIRNGVEDSDAVNTKLSLLDMLDIVTHLRNHNTALKDFGLDANRAFHGAGTLDEYAKERLEKEGGVLPPKDQETFKVVAFYNVPDAKGPLSVVPDNLSLRDVLEPNLVTGFAVFMPLRNYKGGDYEVAIAVDKDIRIKKMVIRAPDGTAPRDLNRAARRYIGKGNRGKYRRLRGGGAGISKKLEKSIHAAFLLGMEAVYMYERDERERFAL
tara:strand:- start:189 stop:1052 length:864 start_codon:yes stop_codon:yes gene_type:complete